MESNYELRKYPNGETRLEVKQYSDLLATELRGQLVSDESAPVVKIVEPDADETE